MLLLPAQMLRVCICLHDRDVFYKPAGAVFMMVWGIGRYCRWHKRLRFTKQCYKPGYFLTPPIRVWLEHCIGFHRSAACHSIQGYHEESLCVVGRRVVWCSYYAWPLDYLFEQSNEYFCIAHDALHSSLREIKMIAANVNDLQWKLEAIAHS